MLFSLTIKDVVLIDRLTIEFGTGFCALTGETGAGKSILLDSLGLALGARSETGLVRKGQEQASVTAEFHCDKKHPVFALLKGQGIDGDPDLVLRRTVASDGRSRAFINDQTVSVGLLKQVGDMLVEIHGQFDTHGLLDASTHRAMLDEYAGVDVNALAVKWDGWRDALKAYEKARADMEAARAEEEYLRGSVEDLDELDPKEGEEEHLKGLRDRLMRRSQIFESLQHADAGLDEMTGAMNGVWRALEKIGDDAAEMIAGMDRAMAEIQEVQAGIQSLSTDLDESEYSLEEIDDRLHALKRQAAKHNCAINELAAVREDLAGRLKLIEGQDDALAELIIASDKARLAYMGEAEKVSKQRMSAAKKLDKLVGAELPPLKLEKAAFVTYVERQPEENWGVGGMDKVAFLVSTNPGREPGPLHKIASGGEMSRFMLALKVVMAEIGTAGSLIFDEVDSGIGGSTAAAVGDRLARLAASRQILVVTHAPQVAARANDHYIVMKSGDKEVKTTVIPLGSVDERREEIARMLAGAEITTEARAAADRLLG